MVPAAGRADDVCRETEGMTMTTYTGTQQVESGLYLNMTNYTMATMNTAGNLPGAEFETYRRIPMIVMLAAAPLLGLAFVMFLPFIGFAMALHLIGTKTLHLVSDAATEGVRVLRPSWAPALAFLSRSKPAKPADTPAAAAPDAWKDDVEKKLNR